MKCKLLPPNERPDEFARTWDYEGNGIEMGKWYQCINLSSQIMIEWGTIYKVQFLHPN